MLAEREALRRGEAGACSGGVELPKSPTRGGSGQDKQAAARGPQPPQGSGQAALPPGTAHSNIFGPDCPPPPTPLLPVWDAPAEVLGPFFHGALQTASWEPVSGHAQRQPCPSRSFRQGFNFKVSGQSRRAQGAGQGWQCGRSECPGPQSGGGGWGGALGGRWTRRGGQATLEGQ